VPIGQMIGVGTALAFALAGGCMALLLHQLGGRRLVKLRGRADSAAFQTSNELRQRLFDAKTKHIAERERLRFAARQEIARLNEGLSQHRHELEARERRGDARQSDLNHAGAAVDQRDHLLAENRTAISAVESEVDEQAHQHRALMQERAGLELVAARQQVVADEIALARLESQQHARFQLQELKGSAPQRARRAMAIASDRYSGVGHLERIQNTILVGKSKALSALADADSQQARLFSQEVGCTLCFAGADFAKTLTVRGNDPLAREIARRVLKQIGQRSIMNADKLKKTCDYVKREVEREIQHAGQRAAKLLDVGKLHPEILHLVGRLKFRLSYSQNQWKHAVEVAYLSGILAEEMGVDLRLARRGGLLHDIGKAMTHDHEGSHAVLGAQVARRCGESEIVANAIGSHHNDEPPGSALALLVTAADAMSGARPGSRRESATSYLDRIKLIQTIASRNPVVERVDIMHAGREVRVIVATDERGDVGGASDDSAFRDADIAPLAREIADALSDELVFPGQVRVTVIRESRSIATAR